MYAFAYSLLAYYNCYALFSENSALKYYKMPLL